ncbi:MAG: flagellar basal body rod protein FlgB [Hyphomicrobium sp.]|uniref:flagellar basal body rod protein FlgB n=1 Tax=Hyphomicrobium sp. TaxID=82 RepID=UPI001326C3B0|nr:flagellar basal body rod protein FlgB [Hyphomicrobium sp.]KAB2943246.1 MAG: flagellar basal body rod protein FlgB [Hyphomicrobium sp.]MBZ0210396.1 flagellar basal body rod protein FlgB [Hyphomicrobium sp.]
MSPISLFSIASQRSHWLSLRQETITGNIAHANTPGYAARDVQPFEAVLQSSQLSMATSAPAHVAHSTGPLEGAAEAEEDSWQTYGSGNSVSIEKELVKAGEVNSAFALNNSVVKAFHRMLLTSTKG